VQGCIISLTDGNSNYLIYHLSFPPIIGGPLLPAARQSNGYGDRSDLYHDESCCSSPSIVETAVISKTTKPSGDGRGRSTHSKRVDKSYSSSAT